MTSEVDAVQTVVNEIVVDSRELVTDVNAVLEDTDDLEADLKSDLDAERTTIVNEINANETKIDTIDGIVDEIVVDSRELVTDVNAVLEDTDDLEADLKSDLDAERTTIVTEINANETKIDTIDGIVDEIVVDSRELVTDVNSLVDEYVTVAQISGTNQNQRVKDTATNIATYLNSNVPDVSGVVLSSHSRLKVEMLYKSVQLLLIILNPLKQHLDLRYSTQKFKLKTTT